MPDENNSMYLPLHSLLFLYSMWWSTSESSCTDYCKY